VDSGTHEGIHVPEVVRRSMVTAVSMLVVTSVDWNAKGQMRRGQEQVAKHRYQKPGYANNIQRSIRYTLPPPLAMRTAWAR